MKIVIIGDSTPPLDEGMKKVASAISTEISNYSPSLLLSPFDFGKVYFWQSLRKFSPDIIHYIPGPSLFSFIFLRILKQWTTAKTVLSMSHPDKKLIKHIVSGLKPDLILFQSKRTEFLYNHLADRHEFLFNGVDLDRFKPIALTQKAALREKYAIPKNKFIVLHVGNLKTRRNLDLLKNLQSNEVQVVVVGGTTIGGDCE